MGDLWVTFGKEGLKQVGKKSEKKKEAGGELESFFAHVVFFL